MHGRHGMAGLGRDGRGLAGMARPDMAMRG